MTRGYICAAMLMAATGCAGDPQSQVDRPDGPTWNCLLYTSDAADE